MKFIFGSTVSVCPAFQCGPSAAAAWLTDPASARTSANPAKHRLCRFIGASPPPAIHRSASQNSERARAGPWGAWDVPPLPPIAGGREAAPVEGMIGQAAPPAVAEGG